MQRACIERTLVHNNTFTKIISMLQKIYRTVSKNASSENKILKNLQEMSTF